MERCTELELVRTEDFCFWPSVEFDSLETDEVVHGGNDVVKVWL